MKLQDLLVSKAGKFCIKWNLVENPDDRFSHEEAYILSYSERFFECSSGLKVFYISSTMTKQIRHTHQPISQLSRLIIASALSTLVLNYFLVDCIDGFQVGFESFLEAPAIMLVSLPLALIYSYTLVLH